MNKDKKIQQLEDRIEKAANWAADYAYIDGAHHKQWVIDMMLRELLTEEELEKNGWNDEQWTENCIAP